MPRPVHWIVGGGATEGHRRARVARSRRAFVASPSGEPVSSSFPHRPASALPGKPPHISTIRAANPALMLWPLLPAGLRRCHGWVILWSVLQGRPVAGDVRGCVMGVSGSSRGGVGGQVQTPLGCPALVSDGS